MWHDHLVICGFGRVAACAVELLSDSFKGAVKILVIDCDPAKAEIAQKLGFSFILGDAASSNTLRVSQVTAAAAVIVCVEDASAPPIIRRVSNAAPQTPITVVLKDIAHQEEALSSGAKEIIVLSQIAGELLAGSVFESRKS